MTSGVSRLFVSDSQHSDPPDSLCVTRDMVARQRGCLQQCPLGSWICRGIRRCGCLEDELKALGKMRQDFEGGQTNCSVLFHFCFFCNFKSADLSSEKRGRRGNSFLFLIGCRIECTFKSSRRSFLSEVVKTDDRFQSQSRS